MRKRVNISTLSVFKTLPIAAAIAWATSAPAYQLYPRATPGERRLSNITANYVLRGEMAAARWSAVGFSEPVHEEITNRMYGCNGDETPCGGGDDSWAPAAVLAGVRWNDDPPFRMTGKEASKLGCKIDQTIRFETQPWCWVGLFKDAEAGAARNVQYGPGDAMLYRTHFGDLQFLHSMAAADNELAAETKRKMLGWFEFTWRAASGEYTLETRLKSVQIPAIQEAFGATEWRYMDLFTQGATGGLRRSIDDVAFGSLLHTVEDSFAAGHDEREESSGRLSCSAAGVEFVAPGQVVSFHSYAHQDHKRHSAADSRSAFMRDLQEPGNVVQVGRALINARDKKLTWEQVRPLFDCLVALRDPNAPASIGDAFRVAED